MGLADHATRSDCWTCNLPAPILEELNQVRRERPGGRKVGPDTVIAWLVAEHGYSKSDIKRGSINYHFQRGHADL